MNKNLQKYPFSMKKGIIFLFLVFFWTKTLNAQQFYVRVFPEDCTNCHSAFFDQILRYSDSEHLKFLFPENYKGNRFKNFNKIYLRGKVKPKQVVFSDSLFQKTGDALYNRSGLIFMQDSKILMAIEPKGISQIPSLKGLIEKSQKLKTILNFHKEGISTYWQLEFNYDKDIAVLNDLSFKQFYFLKPEQKMKVDLKKDKFRTLIYKNTNDRISNINKGYESYLKKISKSHPEYPDFYFRKNKIYIRYNLPFVSRKIIHNNGQTEIDISNMEFMTEININPLFFNDTTYFEKEFIQNSKRISRDKKIDDLVYNTNFSYRDNSIYFFNIYEKSENYPSSKPLLSIYKRNNDQFEFAKYSSQKRFNFQGLSESKLDFVKGVSFSATGDFFLLEDRPYVVDLKSQKKIKLETNRQNKSQKSSSKVKDISEYNFENIQLFERNNFYFILSKNKMSDKFNVFKYNKKWELKKIYELPILEENVLTLGFTKKYFYFYTDEKLMRMPSLEFN